MAKDLNEAYAYLYLAGTKDEAARTKYTSLEKSMTPESKLRVEQRIKELQKAIDANTAAKKAEK